MSYRPWLSATLAWICIAILVPAHVFAQASPAKKWSKPRTPDGHPDLQGLWTNVTLTPLERPAELAGKAALSAQEAAEYEKRTLKINDADRPDLPPLSGRNGYNEGWYDSGSKLARGRRTSLVVDPLDGKVPRSRPRRSRDWPAGQST